MSLLDITPIIEQMLLIADNISDLNFSTGQKPQVEINGSLYSASPLGLGKLSPFQTEMIAMSILRDNAEAARQLVKFGTADLSYSLPSKCRFRVNIFQQRGSFSIVMRVSLFRFAQFAAAIEGNLQSTHRHRFFDGSGGFGKKFDVSGDYCPDKRNKKLSRIHHRRPD